MRILWLTWKDLTHPQAGGAEVVNEELARRMVAEGHEVLFVVGSYAGAKPEEAHEDGYRIVRLGNRVSVYVRAWQYYRAHLTGWADLVIDEVNTVPFFAKFYVREPNILFVHQLCREIWFYELPKLFGVIGYVLEPIYLRMLSDRRVVTVSESTKRDLSRYGFDEGRVQIISEGIAQIPAVDLGKIEKYVQPTLLSLGAIRSMKRTMDQIEAFELAKASMPDLQLKVAGDATGPYGRRVLARIRASEFKRDIQYLGRVSEEQKLLLMQRCHLLMQTAAKEGWGLTITEAAAQGTPALAYNADGLRDSIQSGVTGLIVPRRPRALAEAVVSILGHPARYEQMRKAAWTGSKEVTFEKGYSAFRGVLGGAA